MNKQEDMARNIQVIIDKLEPDISKYLENHKETFFEANGLEVNRYTKFIWFLFGDGRRKLYGPSLCNVIPDLEQIVLFGVRFTYTFKSHNYGVVANLEGGEEYSLNSTNYNFTAGEEKFCIQIDDKTTRLVRLDKGK